MKYLLIDKINEQRDNILDDSIVEQLTDNEESESLPKSEFEQFIDYEAPVEEDTKVCSDKKKSVVLEYTESDPGMNVFYIRDNKNHIKF